MSDIVLPWCQRPGTGMISKLVLQEKQITNFIVEYVIGTRAKDKYRANPPEWINGSISDVLFICNEYDSTLPPVVIEVQHVVDDNFMRRLLGYCLSLEKQSGVLHIVLIFPISSIRFEIMNRIRKRKSDPLLIHYPCHPWVPSCFIFDRSSLEENLQQPLIPFVSLLYRLAQHHVGTTILDHDHIIDGFLSFSNEMKTRLEEVLHLQENDHDNNAAISCLKNTILLVSSCQEKFKQPSTAADSHPNLQTLPQKTDANWDFVKNCIQKLNEGDQISWKAVYQQGKGHGLFSTYSNAASMKRSYYRAKINKGFYI
ncbi:hypothetical protein F4703DRAFT_1942379 [Phycomyces blakesleeanus]